MFFYNMLNKLCFFLLLMPLFLFGQTVLKGVISNVEDTEGIHVFNEAFQKFTVTDEYGGFEISATVNDVIAFSGIQYELKTILITEKHIESGFLEVLLVEKLNELDEVFIGYKLTGDLSIDAKYIEAVVPMEIALTDSFRGLGNYNGILPSDEQSAIGSNAAPEGVNVFGLIEMFIPKNNSAVVPEVIPLGYSRDDLVIYYGGDFFSGHLKMPKEDEERFIQFTELDSIIVVSLRKRNKFELLHRVLQLREKFETSK